MVEVRCLTTLTHCTRGSGKSAQKWTMGPETPFAFYGWQCLFDVYNHLKQLCVNGHCRRFCKTEGATSEGGVSNIKILTARPMHVTHHSVVRRSCRHRQKPASCFSDHQLPIISRAFRVLVLSTANDKNTRVNRFAKIVQSLRAHTHTQTHKLKKGIQNCRYLDTDIKHASTHGTKMKVSIGHVYRNCLWMPYWQRCMIEEEHKDKHQKYKCEMRCTCKKCVWCMMNMFCKHTEITN